MLEVPFSIYQPSCMKKVCGLVISITVNCSVWCVDSCKFLHDRSDYKHGWQLEREAECGSPTRDEGSTVVQEILIHLFAILYTVLVTVLSTKYWLYLPSALWFKSWNMFQFHFTVIFLLSFVAVFANFSISVYFIFQIQFPFQLNH